MMVIHEYGEASLDSIEDETHEEHIDEEFLEDQMHEDFEDQVPQVLIEGQEHEDVSEDEVSHQTHEEHIPIEDQTHVEYNDEKACHVPIEEQESIHEDQEHKEASPSFSIHEDKGLVRHNSPQIFELNYTPIENFEEELYLDSFATQINEDRSSQESELHF